jgi:hypothetical protein
MYVWAFVFECLGVCMDVWVFVSMFGRIFGCLDRCLGVWTDV